MQLIFHLCILSVHSEFLKYIVTYDNLTILCLSYYSKIQHLKRYLNSMRFFKSSLLEFSSLFKYYSTNSNFNGHQFKFLLSLILLKFRYLLLAFYHIIFLLFLWSYWRTVWASPGKVPARYRLFKFMCFIYFIVKFINCRGRWIRKV